MTTERRSNVPQGSEDQPTPTGVDDLVDFYESLEDVYRLAAEASSNYDDVGLTTSHTNFPTNGNS